MYVHITMSRNWSTWCRSLILSFSTCYLGIVGLEGAINCILAQTSHQRTTSEKRTNALLPKCPLFGVSTVCSEICLSSSLFSIDNMIHDTLDWVGPLVGLGMQCLSVWGVKQVEKKLRRFAFTVGIDAEVDWCVQLSYPSLGTVCNRLTKSLLVIWCLFRVVQRSSFSWHF